MKRVPIALAAVLLLASPALADGIPWAKSLEDARKQAKERGSLIFCAMVIDGEADNEAQKTAYRDTAVVRELQNYVCLYANPHTSHGTRKVTVDGVEKQVCRDMGVHTCRDHLNAWNDLCANYDQNASGDGARKIPFQFVIDADGKFLTPIAAGTVEGGFGAVPGPTLAHALRQLTAHHGKGLSAEEYGRLKALLEEAEQAKREKRYEEALKAFQKVIKANPRTRLADRAREASEEIAKQGEGTLAELEEKAGSDPVEAYRGLQELAETYAGTEVGRRASAKVAALKKDPAVKNALETLAADREAAKEYDEAEAALADEKYVLALRMLDRIVKEYEGTPTAKKAAAKAEEVRADEGVRAKLRAAEEAKYCRSRLSMGRNFAKNGMIEQARKKFQEIIDRYPESSWADEARKELANLR